MEFLEAADKRDLKVKSSISQAKDTKLSATNNLGGFFPIVSDHLDYITCDKVKSHPIKISLSDELDYEYPVGKCTYYTDKYVYMDGDRTELRTLPHWFGDAFYSKYVSTNAYINSDTEALGTRNMQEAEVGLSYVEANSTLE